MAYADVADTVSPPRNVQDRAEASAGSRTKLRSRLFLLLGSTVAAGALAWGGWWMLVGSHFVSTDDAYVDASTAEITPQIDGTVASVPVTDTRQVKAGDILVTIDPADSQLALAQAEANHAQAIRRVQQDFADAAAAEAQVTARQADLVRARLDFQRRQALAASGAVSGDELSTARDGLETAEANLRAAQQQLAAQRALIEGSDVANNPQVRAAQALLDKAKLDVGRTIIRAPFDGVVVRDDVQIGQRVQVGAHLMSVVPISQVYVNANFKEGQLDTVHPGQPVTLTSDLYGSSVKFHGHVAGLGGGTGSAFAVIPAQNATGNWIKVVQRLPVRIALDPRELALRPLRVGLSMTATIDTAN